MCETRHPRVFIEYGHQSGDVDAGVAPLILECWKAELETLMSCQDSPSCDGQGRVWICFSTAVDAEDFLRIVAPHYTDGLQSLFNRVSWDFAPDDDDWEKFYTTQLWHYDAAPMAQEDDDGAVFYFMNVSVRFPHADYLTVLGALQTHNAGRADLPV